MAKREVKLEKRGRKIDNLLPSLRKSESEVIWVSDTLGTDNPKTTGERHNPFKTIAAAEDYAEGLLGDNGLKVIVIMAGSYTHQFKLFGKRNWIYMSESYYRGFNRSSELLLIDAWSGRDYGIEADGDIDEVAGVTITSGNDDYTIAISNVSEEQFEAWRAAGTVSYGLTGGTKVAYTGNDLVGDYEPIMQTTMDFSPYDTSTSTDPTDPVETGFQMYYAGVMFCGLYIYGANSNEGPYDYESYAVCLASDDYKYVSIEGIFFDRCAFSKAIFFKNIRKVELKEVSADHIFADNVTFMYIRDSTISNNGGRSFFLNDSSVVDTEGSPGPYVPRIQFFGTNRGIEQVHMSYRYTDETSIDVYFNGGDILLDDHLYITDLTNLVDLKRLECAQLILEDSTGIEAGDIFATSNVTLDTTGTVTCDRLHIEGDLTVSAATTVNCRALIVDGNLSTSAAADINADVLIVKGNVTVDGGATVDGLMGGAVGSVTETSGTFTIASLTAT